MRSTLRYASIGLAALAAIALASPRGQAQFRLRNWTDQNLSRDIHPGEHFTFCRIRFTSDGWDWGGGWRTDYPDSDINFSLRLSELTTIKVNRDENGRIVHDIVNLTDEKLFDYPFVYMLEVGNLYFSDAEAKALRTYLLRGGFLLVDDFWGDDAWDNFAMEMEKVFPPLAFPRSAIRDIPVAHELFHCVFEIKEVPQIPSIGHFMYWRQTGDTYERGHRTTDPSPHCRGIFDAGGRLMVVIMHNTDLGDGWEREAAHPGYFEEFSKKKAYPMGINIVTYAMTH